MCNFPQKCESSWKYKYANNTQNCVYFCYCFAYIWTILLLQQMKIIISRGKLGQQVGGGANEQQRCWHCLVDCLQISRAVGTLAEQPEAC